MTRLVDIAEVFLGRAPPRPAPDETALNLPVLALRDIGARIAPRDQLDRAEMSPAVGAVRLAAVGDIVLTARGRLRAVMVDVAHEGVVVGLNLILLRVKDQFPPSLLLAFLRHPQVEQRLIMESAGTATAGISVEVLRQLPIRLPPPSIWGDAAELVVNVDAYHDEMVEAARLFRQGVSEWLFEQMRWEDLE